MNIIYEDDNHLLYGRLKVGDVFIFEDKTYMLTNQPEEDMDGDLKAVCLNDGLMEIFGKNVKVIRVECDLHIL